jgi:hypothetical protein
MLALDIYQTAPRVSNMLSTSSRAKQEDEGYVQARKEDEGRDARLKDPRLMDARLMEGQ